MLGCSWFMHLEHLFVSELLKDYQLLYCKRQVLLLHQRRTNEDGKQAQQIQEKGIV